MSLRPVPDEDALEDAVARALEKIESRRTSSQERVVTRVRWLWGLIGAIFAIFTGIVIVVRAWDEKIGRRELDSNYYSKPQIMELYEKGSPRIKDAEERIIGELGARIRSLEELGKVERSIIIEGIHDVQRKLEVMDPRTRSRRSSKD